MQFNTYIFILILLPVTVIAYYVVNKIRDNYGKVVLLFSSIIFYAYGDMDTLIVMCVSLAINFLFAKLLEGKHKWRR
ncbi:MAG: MBOAT family protein, partial [Wujia sp.]